MDKRYQAQRLLMKHHFDYWPKVFDAASKSSSVIAGSNQATSNQPQRNELTIWLLVSRFSRSIITKSKSSRPISSTIRSEMISLEAEDERSE